MSKNTIVLFFVVMFTALGHYAYEQGCFTSEIAHIEKDLTEPYDFMQEVDLDINEVV